MSVPRSLTVPHGVRRSALPTPPGPLAALCAGESGTGTPVLLVPGFTGSKEDFLPVLAPLAEAGHPVAAVDLRGQLDTPGPEDQSAYAVPALAAEVLAAAGALGRPLHLVGHSFGGLVTRAATIADPGAVRSLTLLGSGPAAITGRSAQRLVAMAQVYAGGGIAAVWAASQALDAADPGYVAPPPEVAAFLAERFFRSAPGGLLAVAEALRTEPDRTAELRATGVPLLVAHGVADDAWSPEVQRDMAERLAARYAVIPDSEHSPAVENPASTLGVLLDFFRTAG